jgi:hypothetical protein
MGNEPPLNPVRAPAGVTQILVELQNESILETSSTVFGFITTSGGKDKSSVSSCEYWCNISESSCTRIPQISLKKEMCSEFIFVYFFIIAAKNND